MPTSREQIWKSMPGASPLFDVYGYWPTLHDATVTSYSMGYENKEIAVMVDYADLKRGAENQQNILTRIVLLWEGVSEAKLFFYSSDISYIDFVVEGSLIRTVFEQHPNGIDGHILSQSIEVVSVEIEPEETRSSSILPTRHEIVWTYR